MIDNLTRRASVVLVAKTTFLDNPVIPWSTDATCDGDRLVEFAGRVCYQSYGKGRKTNMEYIRHIVESGHGSVLEHGSLTFHVTGVSRTLTHELVRHRAGWAYSQLSQRYVDESKGLATVPPEIQRCYELKDRLSSYELLTDEEGMALASAKDVVCFWETSVRTSRDNYDLIMKGLEQLMALPSDPLMKRGLEPTDRRKAARGTARSVLPGCQETHVVCTVNYRALRHFCEMRGSPAADVEIRAMAIDMLKIAQREVPAVFSDYAITTMADGTEVCETPYRKV